MDRTHAEQIATLLNTRNQLVQQYNGDLVLASASNYLFTVSDSGEVVACAELKRVQWYQFEVCHVTTASGAEGKGLARELLALVEERARSKGCRILQCTIRRDNRRSQTIFSKNGFREVSEFYYPNSGNNVGVWQKVISRNP
jgi:ribosomal protein S18 acetylase RimI-like enzyme